MASNDSADRRRINEVLTGYWRMLKDERPYPLEREVDVDALEDIWDSCFLVRRERDEHKRYTYLYLGAALVEAYGDDLNEREICEKLVFPSSMSLVHKFDEVVETKAPVLEESEFVNAKGVAVRYRSIMLPLGDDDGEVRFIIGGMRWKSY